MLRENNPSHFSTVARNAQIIIRIREGEPQRKIAHSLGISLARVGQIWQRHKEKQQREASVFGNLPVKAHKVLERMFLRQYGFSSFTLIDLKRFVDENHNWEEKLSLHRACGELCMKQIKQFMHENGIL